MTQKQTPKGMTAYVTLEEAKDIAKANRAEWEARARAIARIYRSEDWAVYADFLEKHAGGLAMQLESPGLPHPETNWVRGQLNAVRYVLDLPAMVTRRLAEDERGREAKAEAAAAVDDEGEEGV